MPESMSRAGLPRPRLQRQTGVSRSFEQVAFIGLDISKSHFQVHCLDANGFIVLQKALNRSNVLSFFSKIPSAVVGIETGFSSHHWARQIAALGHDVRIIPARFISAFRIGQKNDANDAEAICRSLMQPSAPEVPIKSCERQAILMVHRSRELLKKQRMQSINFARSLLSEFGIALPLGHQHVSDYISRRNRNDSREIPTNAMDICRIMLREVDFIDRQIQKIEKVLIIWHKSNQDSVRLMTIPGIGIITATALAATVDDPRRFPTSRHFASWLGLVPRQHSSGGRSQLGSITRRGDPYLRRLLISGALPLMTRAKKNTHPADGKWNLMLKRRHTRVVTTAIANKNARIAWAILVNRTNYTDLPPLRKKIEVEIAVLVHSPNGVCELGRASAALT
ncbi:IS110 family transposase [Sphingomonas sp. CARO-RG-8B-R24-01]|uniref:IS110 family transposase n=1 Tax=Sphingomonas sp. CARO-RG-8B-R24-01 TaxID=2914831 RepID=UPI001F5A77B0|nr:IS110 family transposase [Sphingomonas sp. CARO-RG-8B-R24-01]